MKFHMAPITSSTPLSKSTHLIFPKSTPHLLLHISPTQKSLSSQYSYSSCSNRWDAVRKLRAQRSWLPHNASTCTTLLSPPLLGLHHHRRTVTFQFWSLLNLSAAHRSSPPPLMKTTPPLQPPSLADWLSPSSSAPLLLALRSPLPTPPTVKPVHASPHSLIVYLLFNHCIL